MRAISPLCLSFKRRRSSSRPSAPQGLQIARLAEALVALVVAVLEELELVVHAAQALRVRQKRFKFL